MAINLQFKRKKSDETPVKSGTTKSTSGSQSKTITYPTASTAPASSYVGKGTYNDADLPASAKNDIATQKLIYNNAMSSGDINTANAAHDAAEAIRRKYGYSGGEDGSEYLPFEQQEQPLKITPLFPQSSGNGWYSNYSQSSPSPTYSQSKYDPEIDRLLNEILNREDFSYNAENDPIYQQYADMYRREGDRAMKETLAEVAAGAGGMNTYAVTAAQQAANRYASQLGDKIPELYQLAYDMYLADKDSKIQDLGILRDMDATQYNRYRDTMADYKDDRNFAYGVYRDDVEQGNWQKTFDYNAMIDDRNFNYNAALNDRDFAYNAGWDNTKWEASQSQAALENARYDREKADEQIEYLISLGKTPSAELIAKSSWDQADINLAVAAVQAGMANNSGGNAVESSSKAEYTDLTDTETEEADSSQMNSIKDTMSLLAGSKVGSIGNGNVVNEGDSETDSTWTKGLTDLGLGLVYSPNLLVELAEIGAIYELNGTLKWADGWNAQNFQEKMSKTKAFNLLPTL